ncbi:hypothetical protein ACJIZ3_024796 [Penstemon smallii]|uniref:TFIIS N-terminal domain-containing protein n=1 Tax=Penstemon smallii TaxID=265156 RepID=A0ABD3TVD8_9LAMI
MNNGLTAPSRVRELMKDSILKNVGDSTKQWTAVASVIAATENTDCLDLFIELDGLHFIDKWLKDAQKLGSDTSNTFVEDSIFHLLLALEKLHVDYQKLVSSGIWKIVKDLRVHYSSMVQDKAKELFESWKRKRDIGTSLSDVGKIGTLSDNEVRRTDDTEPACGHSESSLGDASLSRETSVKEKGQESTRDDPVLSTSSDAVNPSQVESAHNLPNLLEPQVENDKPLGTTSVESCNLAVNKHTLDGLADFHQFEAPSDTTQTQPEKLISLEESKTSCSDAEDAINCANGDKTSCHEGSSCINFSSSGAFSTKEWVDRKHSILRQSSINENSLGNSKDSVTFPSGVVHNGKIKTRDLDISDHELANNNNIFKIEMNRGLHRADNKSDVELDYGIVDPLELARQVAIEVEREVGDYREQSCSSPEKGLRQPESPNSVSVQKSDSTEDSLKEVANDLDTKQTNRTQVMETPQVTEAAQEEAKAEKGLCNFDLNQEVWSEDNDHLRNQSSTPVSIVSASRAAAAPGLPVAPLQFEGSLGWKGSSAKSAFRPASPRSSSELRIGCLDFDLNVSESDDGRTGPDKHVPLSLTLPSVKTNSRSEHLGLDLNLSSENGGVLLDWRIGQFFSQGNSHDSRSYSSPSSSKQHSSKNFDLNDQPSYPNNSSDHSYLSKLSQNVDICGSIQSNDSVISLMGARVEVNRKDLVSQTPPLQNGRTPGLAFDVNLGRSGSFSGIGSVVPYTDSLVYGTAKPYSSTVYGHGGPIPYMVDSRGATVPVFSQPPFVMNMTNSTPSNGLGPSRSTFDLNSGMMVESGSRDPAGFGQFLNSGQVRSMDEQLRSNGKRKEPDNGLEHYPFKHYTLPWK